MLAFDAQSAQAAAVKYYAGMPEDDISRFLKAFRDTSPLRMAEAREVVPKAQAGDPVAIERMLGSLARYAIKLGKKWHQLNPAHEPIEYATEGLMQAQRLGVPKFDVDRGYQWSTYGMNWVFAAISRMGKTNTLVRLPAHRSEEGDGNEVLMRHQRMTSLDEPVGPVNSEAYTRLDMLESTIETDAPLDARAYTDRVNLFLRPRYFRSRELFIYFRRYRDDVTLEELGNDLGITRERVRQIEKRMIAELTNRMLTSSQRVERFEGCIGYRAPCERPVTLDTGHCWWCWGLLCRDVGVPNRHHRPASTQHKWSAGVQQLLFEIAPDPNHRRLILMANRSPSGYTTDKDRAWTQHLTAQ